MHLEKQKYARLLLEVGVNLQHGQSVLITADPYHWDFLILLTEEAYKMGAKQVVAEVNDARMLKAKVDNSDEEFLETSTSWIDKKYQVMVDENWAKINLFGSRHPQLASALDKAKLSKVQRAGQVAAEPLSEGCGKGLVSWCGAALPTPEWAAQVFGQAASEALCEKLWKVMVSILRLHEENPSTFWQKHGNTIKQRGERLEALNLSSLHFIGAGTDLIVKCLPRAKWIGGGVFIDDRPNFIPNLPTEESFTTPDFRGTEGIAKVVRPVNVLGRPVKGAWFKFKQGKVVEYGADENKDALDDYFDICPQSRYLGEVALVDAKSPIFQSGLIFNCILYDENASSHIALGSCYPMGVPGGLTMTKEKLKEVGANISLVHTDFMIGSPDVEVWGETVTGQKLLLMQDGGVVI